jgi:hypothetical protein
LHPTNLISLYCRKRSTHHRKILSIHGNPSAINFAKTGDRTIAGYTLVFIGEWTGRQGANFLKRARIEE